MSKIFTIKQKIEREKKKRKKLRGRKKLREGKRKNSFEGYVVRKTKGTTFSCEDFF